MAENAVNLSSLNHLQHASRVHTRVATSVFGQSWAYKAACPWWQHCRKKLGLNKERAIESSSNLDRKETVNHKTIKVGATILAPIFFPEFLTTW